MNKCIKCLVSGRVQGVYFRSSTQKQAHVLGLTGYAKNLPNGCVEVLMCGDVVAMESLQNWLAMGPQYAEVKNVQCEKIDLGVADMPQQFSIG